MKRLWSSSDRVLSSMSIGEERIEDNAGGSKGNDEIWGNFAKGFDVEYGTRCQLVPSPQSLSVPWVQQQVANQAMDGQISQLA